jgi:hypothetical protein
LDDAPRQGGIAQGCRETCLALPRFAQKALKADPDRATVVGRKLFPPTEASLIAELIRRDAPYYDSAISERAVESMNRFARDLGVLSRPVRYEEVVWTA